MKYVYILIIITLIVCACWIWYVIYKDIKKRIESKRMLEMMRNNIPIIHVPAIDPADAEKIKHLKEHTEYLQSLARQQLITDEEWKKELAEISWQLSKLEKKYAKSA